MIVLQETAYGKTKTGSTLERSTARHRPRRPGGREGSHQRGHVGAKAFSLLVNTVKAADSCAVEGSQGHKHDTEHGLYCLSGKGRYVISGEEYELRPNVAVFVPANEYHYIINDSPTEPLTYIIFYVPGGKKKIFLKTSKEHTDETNKSRQI
jgi:quercetin dioxygenase-like cupin family protein